MDNKDAISKKELINDIENAIKATNMIDEYSVGLRNGMRCIKSFIDDKKPKYEKCPENKPCTDVISRQDALDVISRIGLCKCNTNEVQAVDECLRAVKYLPSVSTEKTGRWKKKNPFLKSVCSECGESTIGYHGFDETLTKYCPNCGAKMVVKE